MEILVIFIWGFLLLRTIISLVNALSAPHLPDKNPATCPRVSILIPARNEEAVIGKLLTGLQKLNYPDFEVMVCSDHSSDKTEEILSRFADEDNRIRWFQSMELPAGWIGKNFACHQLARKASGKYFVFLDADVEVNTTAITKAVAFFQEKKLMLLSVFPQQKMETFAERITVPVMNWILQSLLPLILVQKTRSSSLSAANGQFMMFEAANYQINQWHSKVWNLHVEDIRLARIVKSASYKMAVMLGNNDITCRMYRHFNEAIVGFSRNMHEYFGGQRLVMTGFWLMVCLGPFIIFAVAGWQFFGLFVLIVVVNSIFVSVASRQNLAWAIFLHPLQMISFTAIVFYNIFRRIRKNTTWKGRKIKF